MDTESSRELKARLEFGRKRLEALEKRELGMLLAPRYRTSPMLTELTEAIDAARAAVAEIEEALKRAKAVGR